ncbi:hypothetical protein TNCV_1205181 [Trichonephila clavipes]|nr:hypothetical protein TNCV_1205181 [Trichonephila clavipes]
MTAERSGEDTKLVCDTCHRTFQFRRHYLKHMQEHPENVLHECFECASAFHSNIQYFDHLRTHVQESNLRCLYCNDYFRSPEARRLHENQHTRGNRFICKTCHSKFQTKSCYNNIYCYMGLKNLLILECAIEIQTEKGGRSNYASPRWEETIQLPYLWEILW